MSPKVIVFSKNRPLQLYACLESLFKYTKISADNVWVVFKADHDYVIPYYEVLGECIRYFGNISMLPEYDFRAQVMQLLEESKHDKIMFLTDDDVFKEPADLNLACKFLDQNPPCFAFSLRLGKHLTRCYSTQSPQAVPSGFTKEPFFVWTWKGTEWDWNYPLSVDGHIFRKNDIVTAAKGAGAWKSPNTFEGNMSHLHPQIPHPQMACYTTTKVFNIPHNRVQDEVQNVHGGGSENDLLKAWNDGKKIDIASFQGIKNISAHQLVPIVLKDRK